MNNPKNEMSRRKFFGNAAAVSAVAAAGMGYILTSCSSDKGKAKFVQPQFLDKAPDGKPLKAGLIGCGGRGTGAALNFLEAGSGLSITAMGDMFPDRMATAREKLKKREGGDVPDDKCFLGFDAYKRVIESDVDVIILATPPYFRPEHFKAAIEARKHVFMEKPVAVDPVGARSIIASAKKAEALGLSVVTGTQRRHQRNYLETYAHVVAGEIGTITGANAYWNQGKLWHRDRQPEWTDMEFMLRDWVNWCWLSGDHIVEQHIHNIDVINWFMGKFPVKAVGMGSRMRRVTGDQFDNFSVDFVYEGDIHMHSMCRQINGCANNVSELIRGTEGYTNCLDTIYTPDGQTKWTYAYPPDKDGKPSKVISVSASVQEHIDLVTAIRTDTPINEAETTANSTLAGIMGRISAYTGKEVTWEEMLSSELKLGPDVLEMGKVDMKVQIPVPGEAVIS